MKQSIGRSYGAQGPVRDGRGMKSLDNSDRVNIIFHHFEKDNKEEDMKFKTRVTTDFSCWIAISILSIFLMGGTAVYAQSDSNNSGSATNAADTLQVDLMFVLDNSGSMIQNDPKFITREVVTNTLNSLTQNFRVGMVVFDKDARLVQALTAVDTQAAKNTIAAKLDRINYRGQFTNTPAAVERAVYELKTNGREEAKKAIILLTDGIVDTGNKDQDLEGEKWLKEDLAAESKKAGIRIFGVAFTDTADFRLMQSLALQTEGEYFRAYSIDDIQSIFNSIEDILRKPSETLKEKAAVEIAEPGTIVIEKPVPVALPNTPAEPEPAPKSNLPLSILLAGLVAIVIIFVILLFMRRNKDVIIRADSFRSVSSPLSEEAMPDSPAELIDADNIISDTSLTLSLPLDKRVVRIGRDTTNDIIIPRKSVSSFHATIEHKNGYYYLEDHRSTNGTKLNNEKIRENAAIRLKSGDTIHFADCEFRFLMPDMAPYGETVMIGRDESK